MLKIKKLKVRVGENQILKGVDLEIRRAEVHVVMGPNGSGKSTLAHVLAGSPQFIVHSGQMTFEGHNLKKLSPDKRAKMGIFLGFQNPVEIPGVSVFNVLRKAKQVINYKSQVINGKKKRTKTNNLSHSTYNLSNFRQQLLEYASSLKLSPDHLGRAFNDGFSGGEKKRNEILQMLALSPKLVILDEIDSGLDVDGLKLVAGAIKKFALVNRRSSLVIITHYARILKYIKADFVHVMVDGRIIKSGKASLASEIENRGYGNFRAEFKGQSSKVKVAV